MACCGSFERSAGRMLRDWSEAPKTGDPESSARSGATVAADRELVRLADVAVAAVDTRSARTEFSASRPSGRVRNFLRLVMRAYTCVCHRARWPGVRGSTSLAPGVARQQVGLRGCQARRFSACRPRIHSGGASQSYGRGRGLPAGRNLMAGLGSKLGVCQRSRRKSSTARCRRVRVVGGCCTGRR
jgi:hypothetical protein